MACGFADGEPIATGSGGQGTSGSTSSGGTSASTSDTSSSADDTSSSEGGPAVCACVDPGVDQRCLRFINRCERSIVVGASGEVVPADAFGELGELAPQACTAVAIDAIAGGRAWAATDCVAGECSSSGGDGRGTLIQFALPQGGTDVYDVTLVDGFNLPMAMVPVSSTCESADCAADLRAVCDDGLVHLDDDGAIAWCESSCRACSTCDACVDCGDVQADACMPCAGVADVCCTGQGCGSNEITTLWKRLCPDAITYSGEGPSFTCNEQSDFDLVFCP